MNTARGCYLNIASSVLLYLNKIKYYKSVLKKCMKNCCCDANRLNVPKVTIFHNLPLVTFYSLEERVGFKGKRCYDRCGSLLHGSRFVHSEGYPGKLEKSLSSRCRWARHRHKESSNFIIQMSIVP
ncbi:hypothetical protein ANTPLA_LOCUS5638 [Anthophora plagiata]